MFENILVCLDGSKLAEQILPYAAEEARRFHSNLVLLHVIPEPVIVTPGVPGAAGVPVETSRLLQQMEKEQNEASAYLEHVAGKLRERDLPVESVILQGSAGSIIVSHANETGIDLIAIATHGRGGLGRAVFGSVSDYILRYSGLPILLIRSRKSED